MNEQYFYVFNQYYIDLLKKVKKYASDIKDSNDIASHIHKTIKENYKSMDKMSQEYVSILKNNEFWDSYESLEEPWKVETFSEIDLYKNITFNQVVSIFKEKYTLHHYMLIFSLFRNENIEIDNTVELLKNISSNDFEERINNLDDKLKSVLLKLNKVHEEQKSNIFENELKGLEGTSLGKLAKEIMEDMNIKELQDSLQSGENIMETLQNPDNNISKMIGNVSSKMISKIASGELQQETLLSDALSLVSKLPSMMPGGTGGMGGMGGMADMMKGMGDFGKMFQQFQKMGFDPTKMMGELGSKQNRGKVKSHMDRNRRKNIMSERLKKKLNNKHISEKNNIQNEVVENNDD